MKTKYATIVIIAGIVLLAIAGTYALYKKGSSGSYASNSVPTQATNTLAAPVINPDTTNENHYIEITGGCDWQFSGECVLARSGPGLNYSVVLRLREGIVFEVDPSTVDAGGYTWYKIVFDEDLKYPDRVKGDWYVADEPSVMDAFLDPGIQNLAPGTPAPTDGKYIVVSLSEQKLYAYQGTSLFMEESVSTGIAGTPTDPGTFTIFKKTPTRYMQGPDPGLTDEYYDLPGISWDMYFTADGAALHGTYWHNNFGHPMSHGCVNQPYQNAKKLYYWADLGTPVIVQQ